MEPQLTRKEKLLQELKKQIEGNIKKENDLLENYNQFTKKIEKEMVFDKENYIYHNTNPQIENIFKSITQCLSENKNALSCISEVNELEKYIISEESSISI